MADRFTEAYEFLRQGGWPMIPLALCSVAALAVIFERLFALRRRRVIQPRLADLIVLYDGSIGLEPIIHAARRAHGPFARIVEAVIDARKMDRSHALETMTAAGRKEVGTLDRGLIVLEIVAGISPLIGLLGTVLGMVTVFDAIAVQGLGNAQVLSAGISKALVTTVAGLCIAIPALAFHSIFTRRVEALAADMQELATAFVTRIYGPAPAGEKPMQLLRSDVTDDDDVSGEFVGKLR